jgi:hypothetical protein
MSAEVRSLVPQSRPCTAGDRIASCNSRWHQIMICAPVPFAMFRANVTPFHCSVTAVEECYFINFPQQPDPMLMLRPAPQDAGWLLAPAAHQRHMQYVHRKGVHGCNTPLNQTVMRKASWWGTSKLKVLPNGRNKMVPSGTVGQRPALQPSITSQVNLARA